MSSIIIIINNIKHYKIATNNDTEMASSSFRALFTGEEVHEMLDIEGEDGDADEIFFPGSDEEFGFQEEEIET